MVAGELSVCSSTLIVPSGPAVIAVSPMTIFALGIVSPVKRSVTRISISGLAHSLGTVKVKSTSARGTAKSAILSGQERRSHSRPLFPGVVRLGRGGEPDWARLAARPNRIGETLDCIQLPSRGLRDCADYPACRSAISGPRRCRNQRGTAFAPPECITWPPALPRVW